MNRESLKEIVRVKMDEIAPEDQVASHPIAKHIDREMDEAATFIQENAPLHLLNRKVIAYSGDTVVHDPASKTAYVKVPEDFLRLAIFNFSDWERPVHALMSQESNKYSIQQNPYTRAGKAKPVVAQVFVQPPTKSEFNKWFMCVEVENNDTSPTLYYIGTAKPEAMPDRLAEAIGWITASRLFQIFGMGDHSKAAAHRYNEFIASKQY